MKRLIVTADDFGLSVPVNEAIETAFQHGILTAASLMVTGPAAGDAIARAQRLRGLKVGLHVVLVRGCPVLPPADVPDLVNQDGEFSTNLVLAGVKYFFSRAVRRQLEAEIRAQFEVFRATGLELDHVNAHNHMQLHPTVCALTLQVGREYGLRAMRVPYEPLLCAWRVSHARLGQRLGSWALLGSRAVLMTSGLRRAHIAFNDYLFGIQDTGQMTADRVLGLIAGLPDGVSEFYFHPSVRRSPETPWPARYACEEELAALISPAVAAALRAADIQRISYSDLIAH